MTPPTVTRLDWDSSFFGFEIGRLDHAGSAPALAKTLCAVDAAGLACCYLVVPSADAAALATAQDAGFRVVDVRVTLTCLLEASVPLDRDAVPAEPGDRKWVTELAGTRITLSRFAADPRFPRDAAGRMFRAWAARGFDDTVRTVLVAPERRGFVVWGRDGDDGVIELIASAYDAPRGTGRRLLLAAHADFVLAGCTGARVVTQGANVAALGLYGAAGYRVSSTEFWLHRWA